MNPILEQSKLDYEAIDFASIKTEHFIPALDHCINEAKEIFEKTKEKPYTFESVVVAGEAATDNLNKVISVFYGLYGAHCTDELSAIAEEFNQKLTDFNSDVSLDPKIFEGLKAVYATLDSGNYSVEEKTLIEKLYSNMTRNGALLSETDKEKLREIDQKLSKLALQFGENQRNATNEYKLVVEDESRLKGLPANAITQASETAKEKGDEGKWVFTLDYPSYFPLLTYCEDRELRKELWEVRQTFVSQGKYDNTNIVLDIVKTRLERAKLLGYKDHPSFVLEKRMAKNPEKVIEFIKTITDKAMPFAKKDVERISTLKKELTGDPEVKSYDASFYAEKLKKKELDFDSEEIRPYFQLENVIEGAFKVAEKLFKIKFSKRDDLPVYHEDVRVYEVRDLKDNFVGLFYGDYFPRKEKRSGAWMTNYREGGLQFGEVKRPFVTNVCNLTKPTADKPSLLTLNEVRTIFHELGHGLHSLLTQTKYRALSGTNVYWDFVELPSQVLENWLTEKECLDLFAKHYETGELIPNELVEKIKKSGEFLEGVATIRQMRFAYLDMNWHLTDPSSIKDVQEFEFDTVKDYNLYGETKFGSMSCSFGHIFAGGYSSGYYSYKWAEVLDADAFAYFKENGIFNEEIGDKFKAEILERGGSEDPMELYKRFRGHEPSTEALMERCGFSS